MTKPSIQILITLVILLVSSVGSMAAEARIGFSGTVIHPVKDGTVSYPQTLVSFSSRVALPLKGTFAKSSKLIVRDQTGKRKPVQKSSFMTNGSNQERYLLVDLQSKARQAIEVCAAASGECIRYRIIRY